MFRTYRMYISSHRSVTFDQHISHIISLSVFSLSVGFTRMTPHKLLIVADGAMHIQILFHLHMFYLYT